MLNFESYVLMRFTRYGSFHNEELCRKKHQWVVFVVDLTSMRVFIETPNDKRSSAEDRIDRSHILRAVARSWVMIRVDCDAKQPALSVGPLDF